MTKPHWFITRLFVAAGVAIMAGTLVATPSRVVDVELASHTGARWERPRICIADYTGRWSLVGHARWAYDRHQDLRVIRRGPGGCHAKRQVIRVYAGYYGLGVGWAGAAYISAVDGRLVSPVAVYLNKSAGVHTWPRWKRQRLIAHEVGHAVGLQHTAYPHSIVTSAGNEWHKKPTRYDMRHLDRLYPW